MKRFEQRLEGLMSGSFAKVFNSQLQPAEIAGALLRECDNNATIWNRDQTVVPNDFVVELSAPDNELLSPYVDRLGDELANMVRDYANQRRYTFMGPVKVHLEKTADLDTGLYRVRSRTLAGSTNRQAPGSAPADPQSDRDESPPTVARSRAQVRHWIEVNGTRHQISRPTLVLGRGMDADVRIDGVGVSRRHCEIRIGTPSTIQDLGSTNGMVVDGQHTTRATLRDGSRIVVGGTTIVYRRTEEPTLTPGMDQQGARGHQQDTRGPERSAPASGQGTRGGYEVEDVIPAADSLDSALARLFLRLGPPPELTGLQITPVGSDDGGAQE
ncbi:hypothetical protein GCM10022420_000550 [Streptomyces iranensis]|uniref:FHA domain containing protein n=1 Tax=Streptomyces iranensis TaxID=576784 RepID=A0A060ZWM6_9ACTN|nr:hypothetical protein [Streptomyces iranensis]CDR07873.1 FHA domain containing protein [Streptomyces iranensis]